MNSNGVISFPSHHNTVSDVRSIKNVLLGFEEYRQNNFDALLTGLLMHKLSDMGNNKYINNEFPTAFNSAKAFAITHVIRSIHAAINSPAYGASALEYVGHCYNVTQTTNNDELVNEVEKKLDKGMVDPVFALQAAVNATGVAANVTVTDGANAPIQCKIKPDSDSEAAEKEVNITLDGNYFANKKHLALMGVNFFKFEDPSQFFTIQGKQVNNPMELLQACLEQFVTRVENKLDADNLESRREKQQQVQHQVVEQAEHEKALRMEKAS